MKIRASQLGKLMTQPKTKKAKEAGELSETAKSYLDELAIEKFYKRRKVVRTDELRKGIECEERAITMLQEYVGTGLFKNEEQYENDYFTGTPDLVSTVVYDTKVPFDIFNFHKAEPPVLETGKKTDYYWQLQAYMDLTGVDRACLAYVLVNTPEKMVQDKKYRMQFQYADGEEDLEYQEDVDYLERLHNYDDLELEHKVKLFPVEKCEEDIEAAKDVVVKAKEYLSGWTL